MVCYFYIKNNKEINVRNTMRKCDEKHEGKSARKT